MMEKLKMGTLAWGASTGGRLDADEKVLLARNVASMRAEMAFDEARHRLGLLRPAAIELAALAPPDTKLVRDADDLARSVYDDVLWAHCLRTYYFGALVAAHDGIEFDREVFYAAALCHDVGVDGGAAGSVAACCFAHSGALVASGHFAARGHGQAALRIGEAIASHMNLFVPADDYSPENSLVAIGATCDIFGAYARRIAPATLAATVKLAPREGLFEAFGPFLSQPHMEDSRTALLVKMGVFEADGQHPIEAILASSPNSGA